MIEGHFAKANRHWQALAGHETLVVFSGPHSYVSPSLYTEELSVPTWNYIAIHAYGTMELIEDDRAKDALLKDLIALHEPPMPTAGAIFPTASDAPCSPGSLASASPSTRIEGKFKISQNRNEANGTTSSRCTRGRNSRPAIAGRLDAATRQSDTAAIREPVDYANPPALTIMPSSALISTFGILIGFTSCGGGEIGRRTSLRC